MSRSRPPAISFELDARIELLSALVMLARPEEHARRFKARSTYADAVRERFAPLAGHAAVIGLRLGVLPEHVLTELILLQPDPRKLELDPALSAGLLTQAGGERKWRPCSRRCGMRGRGRGMKRSSRRARASGEEHLVRAITLRALKLGGKGKSYAEILNRYARGGYPYLEDLCARLEDYEASQSGAFVEFYPGLIGAFKL